MTQKISRRLAALASSCLLWAACGASPDPQAAGPQAADATAAVPRQSVESTKNQPSTMSNSLYDLQAQALDGSPFDLGSLRGKVTLVVNVASACGYTPQYKGLQQLHQELAARGFCVLGVPSNDFGGQEPGSAEQIAEFCSSKYAVTFPMLAKQQVKAGEGQSPLYAQLGQHRQLPNWNFCKYLIGKDGQVIGFYPSRTGPDDAQLRRAIEQAL